MKLHSADKTPARGGIFIVCENASIRWHFYRLWKCLNQVVFLSSWLERPTQVALYWRVWHFDHFFLSSILNDMNEYAMNFHDKMTWNDTYNDVICGVMHEMRDMREIHAMREMRHKMMWNVIHWFWLHAMRCNLDSFDLDHNLIILFLTSLKIWSIGVNVKLTQQDVKNPCLQIAPPYYPFSR